MSLFGWNGYNSKKENAVFDASRYSNVMYKARSGSFSGKIATAKRETVSQLRKKDYHGNPEKETNQFTGELYSRLFEDSDMVDGALSATKTWQHTAHEIIDQLPEFEKLQHLCNDDPDLSAMGTAELIKNLSEQIGDIAELNIDPDSDDYKDMKDDKRSKFRKAVNYAIDELGDINEAIKGAGLTPSKGKGENKRGVFVQRLRQNRRMRDVLKKAGRLLSMMDGKPTKTRQSKEEVVGIEHGRDLRRLTNQSKAYLSDPVTQDIFYSKWASHELELQSMDGKEPLGRGDLMLLVDHSGSMLCSVGGDYPCPQDKTQRNTYARALCLAILNVSIKEKRRFRLLDFGYEVSDIYTVENGIYKNRDKDLSRSELIEAVATKESTCGTNFNVAFNEALPVPERSDLIFITDGEDRISNEVRKKIDKAREDGLRIFTVSIGGGVRWIHEISDVFIDISSLLADDIDTAMAGVMKAAANKN